jgi:hypothetical protein
MEDPHEKIASRPTVKKDEQKRATAKLVSVVVQKIVNEKGECKKIEQSTKSKKHNLDQPQPNDFDLSASLFLLVHSSIFANFFLHN